MTLTPDRRRRVLVLYDHNWLHVKTIVHYLESFRRFSACDVSYATSFARCRFDLDFFDAVVIHYSVKVCYPGHLSPSFAKALRAYRGVKVLFIQDEYECTEVNRRVIEDLGVGVVFTCVPDESIDRVYPRARFPGVEFVNVLTGYVPLDVDAIPAGKPIRDRKVLIGYRGRNIGYWYGDLAQEKVNIGKRMRALCDARGLTTDIGWEEHDRIYGDDWFRFLGGCKATLGTESGANVFDDDGSLALDIQRALARNPGATYEEIRAEYLNGRDGAVAMTQISPKIFEAIACRTALVLFEGQYSGVLEPGTHYLPLKKDFGNVDAVLDRLHDDVALETMTRRAYDDVIASGRYSYQGFVRRFDDTLQKHWGPAARPAAPWLPLPPCDALADFRRQYERNFEPHRLKRLWRALPGPVRAALGPVADRQRLKRWWVSSPGVVRHVLQPVLVRVRGLLKRAY
jgi:hypothetical protein